MRIIPKNTKVKLQFYRNITLIDVFIALIALALICLALSSNLSSKWIIALVILIVVAPLYISFGELRLYQMLGYFLKFIITKKQFSKAKHGKSNIASITPYLKIENGIIYQKNNYYTGIIKIAPINFNLLNENKQNFIIDNVFASVLKSIGVYQSIGIIKVDEPLILDNYIESELNKLKSLISANEHGVLNEPELRSRTKLIEDRINTIDYINSKEKICASNYYLMIHDLSIENLKSLLSKIENILTNNNITAHMLDTTKLYKFIKYTYTKNFDERELKNNNFADILPNQVKFKTNKVIQDKKQISHFVITDYPLQVSNAWGQELFDLPNTKVVLKAEPVEKIKAIKRLDTAINELLSQKDLGKTSFQIDKETHLSSLQSTLIGLQNDNESFFDVSLVITVYDELNQNKNKKMVRQKLRELGFKFNELFGRQIDGYMTSLITKDSPIKQCRGMNSSVLSACFPFVGEKVMDKDGFLIGENKLLAFLNPFERTDERVNSNMVIIGKSGSGKSFATKTLLANLAADNARVFILDPENEYGTLVKNLNGKVLDVSSSKDGIINPLHIIKSLDDENNDGTSNSFYLHLQFLEEFFKLVLTGINTDSLELLNKIILEVYKNKKITAKTDISKLQAKDYPTLQNLVELVDKKIEKEQDEYAKSCLKTLSNYLSKFNLGARNSALWNGYTSFEPQENFVCFNFQKLLSNRNNLIANAQMLLVLKWLDNEIIKNREYNELNSTNRKIIIAIDEAHVFIDEKYPIALDFMYQLAKRIRKYNGMQIVITQNIKDFTGSLELARKASAIINVSQYSLIFNLPPSDMNDLCGLYEKSGQINETESEIITNLPRGYAFLIISPQNRTTINIHASELVQEVFNKINYQI